MYVIVVDGLMHFTHKREVEICLLIQNGDLTKLDSKCTSGLTRCDGKVHLIVYCIEDGIR